MGEALKRPEQTLQPDDRQRAVDEIILYLLANQSKECKQPDDPSQDEGDAHYLKARLLGERCGVGIAQLLEDASINFDGAIKAPHRLSELKDELSEAARERIVFH